MRTKRSGLVLLGIAVLPGLTPDRVVAQPLDPTVTQVGPGYGHSCALTTGGGVKCWGYNIHGQLGDGTFTDRLTPVNVSGLSSGAVAIAVGGLHTCALTTGGGVECWGYNDDGQLGDGTTEARANPVQVQGLTSGVASLSASGTCALTTSGGVKCWGANYYGQLGDGTTTTRHTPVDVLGLSSGVASISSGGARNCAVTTGGGMKCWGWNIFGALGDGTTTDRLTPVDVLGLTSGVAGESGGAYHTCALTTSGGVKCWGGNGSGELGDGTTTDRLGPVDVVGLTGDVAQIAAGLLHTCASTTAGAAKCWGFNHNGQLGDYTVIDRTVAVDVIGLSNGVASVLAGTDHTCALSLGGGVKCWGANGWGRLGNGTTNEQHIPASVVGLNQSAQSITFTPPASLTVGGSSALGATASSGLPVTFDTWTPGTCTVTGSLVTATATALCGIRASQVGDAGTPPAPQQLRLIPVLAAAPTVAAPTSGFIKQSAATLGGTVTSNGGAAIVERGVVYAPTLSNANPQIGGSGVTQLSTSGGSGVFSVVATGLTPSTDYSYRAYATNTIGTAYSAVATFGTTAPPARVFVSSSGNDVDVCSTQTTPCRSLAEATGQVATDGEVIVLTTGEYETAPLTISKGLKITSPTGAVAFVRQAIVVNAPGARVVLRGLTLKGAGTGDAITVIAADSLSVEDTTIDRWANGVILATAAPSRVSVLNCVLRANATGLKDTTGGPANLLMIDESRFEGNGMGVEILASSAFVRGSAFAGSINAGIVVGPGSAVIQRSDFALNAVAVSALSGGTIRIGRSAVFGNGLGFSAAAGSTFESFGSNVVKGNATDTAGTIVPNPES